VFAALSGYVQTTFVFGIGGTSAALSAVAFREPRVRRRGMRRAVLAASPQMDVPHRSIHIMKGTDPKAPQELVGIVISGMPRTQKPPIFSAYVWAPPNTSDESETKAV